MGGGGLILRKKKKLLKENLEKQEALFQGCKYEMNIYTRTYMKLAVRTKLALE